MKRKRDIAPRFRAGLVPLLFLIAAAVALSYFLRSNANVGENVGGNPLVHAIRADTASPASDNPDADLTVIVFEDYRCSACKKAWPELQRAIAADGRIRTVYKDWPIFGPPSEHAARIGLATRYQNIYPQVHDALMRAPDINDSRLRMAVERAGGSWAQVERDLALHGTAIDGLLNEHRRQAFALNLAGTPGYLIGPILVRGAVSQDEFERAFRRARETGAGG